MKNKVYDALADAIEIGDILLVTDSKHGHRFQIGDIVEVADLTLEGDGVTGFRCNGRTDFWWLEIDEVEKLGTTKEPWTQTLPMYFNYKYHGE